MCNIWSMLRPSLVFITISGQALKGDQGFESLLHSLPCSFSVIWPQHWGQCVNRRGLVSVKVTAGRCNVLADVPGPGQHTWLSLSPLTRHGAPGDHLRSNISSHVTVLISLPGRPRHRQAVSAFSNVFISVNCVLPRSCQEQIYKIYIGRDLLLISLKPVKDFLINFVTVLVIDKIVNTSIWSHETLHIVSDIESHFITNKFYDKYISWGIWCHTVISDLTYAG